jgi:hypothetical protein
MSDAPEFEYEIRLCENFEAALDQVGEAVEVGKLASIALDAGRLLIQAPGGAGKTTTFARARKAAAESGLRTLEVWAVDWVATVAGRDFSVDIETLDETLEAVSRPAMSSKSFADGVQTVLFVDGLNELQTGYAGVLLDTVDRWATRYPQLGVVLADRLARRTISDSWQLATITPVPTWQIRELVGSDVSESQIGLLGNPFFLERARLDRVSARTHREFFVAQLHLEPEVLLKLAAVVDAEYNERADRLMQTESLIEALGDDVVNGLIDAGVLFKRNDETSFLRHHLLSDFLAALHLADRPLRWTPGDFDALTFKAASFDALAFLLEEVSEENVDTLIRRVYDWNFYGAAYLLAHDDIAGGRISDDIRTALLVLLAERRFDKLVTTARQASDALALQKSAIAESLRSVQDVEAVLALVRTLPLGTSWFEEWRALFLYSPIKDRTPVLEVLRSADGILGWTSANVLKRRQLDDTESNDVIALLQGGTPTERWRAAHVLGRSQEPRSVNALLSAINDPYHWVCYGAIRSLIEIASLALAQSTREEIFLRIADMGAHINSIPELAREVERSLKVDISPPSWAEDAGLLLECLWAASKSVEEQDRWRRVSADLRGIAA